MPRIVRVTRTHVINTHMLQVWATQRHSKSGLVPHVVQDTNWNRAVYPSVDANHIRITHVSQLVLVVTIVTAHAIIANPRIGQRLVYVRCAPLPHVIQIHVFAQNVKKPDVLPDIMERAD